MLSKLSKLISIVTEYIRDIFKFIYNNGYSPLFGKDKIPFLMNSLQNYNLEFSTFPAEKVIGALQKYLEYHSNRGIHDPFLEKVKSFVGDFKLNSQPSGGVKPFTVYQSDSGGRDFLLSRSSCRLFNKNKVDNELIKQLVSIAQSAPSQCNRQSVMVHCYQESDQIRRLLELQGGSRGFAEKVGNLFVISSDTTAWGGPGQRNQLYVDGAIFSTSVLYSIHALGLIGCPLNLAVTNKVEDEIKTCGQIPGDQRLIMMIAFGAPIDGDLFVASSPRRSVNEILSIH